MKHFSQPIQVREEFFYEVLLPHLYPNPGDQGWDIDVSTPTDSVYVELKALEDPSGKSYTASAARKLMLGLHRKSRMAPFYVYGYQGSHHQRTDNDWRIEAAADFDSTEKMAELLLGIPDIVRVWIYGDTGGKNQASWLDRMVGIRPYKVRFVEIEDFRDVSLWETDMASHEAAMMELRKLDEEMKGVGSIYVRIREFRR